MPRVIHFEISADNPEALAEFYRSVFEWRVEKWDGPIDYWLIRTGEEEEPGIDGAIMQRQDPSARTIVTVDVPSVTEFVQKVEASGGTAVMPRTAVPGVGYMVYCSDPQGNVFGMMEDDPTAE